jgi:hypothetical protein
MRLGAEKPLSAFAYYTAWLMYIGLFFVKHQCKYAKKCTKNEASRIHTSQTFLDF